MVGGIEKEKATKSMYSWS